MQVAKMLNIDRSTYAYYETGKTKPDVDTLLKLCVVYDVTLDYLVGNREDNCRAVLAAVDNAPGETDVSPTVATLDRQEQRALLLFKLCEDKEGAIRILREMAVENPGKRFINEDNER